MMMSETTGFGALSWLPPRVLRRQAAEDAAEKREAKRAEREREACAEQAADNALAAYRVTAELNGDVVSALALASARVPADEAERAAAAADAIQAVLSGKLDEMTEQDKWQAARDAAADRHVFVGEPVIGRSDGWPESPYEAERAIARAEELHRDLVAARVRYSYPAAEAAARAKMPAADRSQAAVRSADSGYYDAAELTRGTENAIAGTW
jgi:hypothetical protein